jgi:transcriptional regulator with XRE-family HTH domain
LAGIERGRRNPSLRNLENLAVALGISLPKLFESD